MSHPDQLTTGAAASTVAAPRRARTVSPVVVVKPVVRSTAAVPAPRRAREEPPDRSSGPAEHGPDQHGHGQVRRTPCATHDMELWFAASPAALEEAKALCGDCFQRAACLAGAIERREPWGVWGGEIFDGGVVVPFKRGRGRPPRSA